MIKTTSKLYSCTFENIYFPRIQDIGSSKSDITKYVRFKTPVEGFNNNYHSTCSVLITDLSKSEEDILGEFSRTTKQQIRKCMKENSVDIKYYTYEDLEKDEQIIADFKKTYMSYCEQSDKPHMTKAYSDDFVHQLIHQRCILMTKAEFPNGKVYHLYIWDSENSYLIFIASDRLKENVEAILAGMANKLLIYKGMLWLKAKGVRNYELGDISDRENPDSIEKFKLLFGGSPVKVYTYYVGNTTKGRLMTGIKKRMSQARP